MSSIFTNVFKKLSSLFKPRFVRYGVPFLVLVVGGSFGLKEFAQLRYTFSTKQKLSQKDVENLGLDMKDKKVTLDSAYEEIKQINIDDWKNIRGPRPWEEPSPELEAMRNKNKNKTKD